MRLEVTEGLGWNAGNRVAYARPGNGEIVLGRYRPGHGFCETCQQVKPRKGKAMKGWKCRDCRGGGMTASQPVRPRCYNRPPFAAGRTEHGISRDTGARVETYLVNDWFEDRCATWDGVGIGQPTDEYPTGTPYPIAHGFDCDGCRWKPEGTP